MESIIKWQTETPNKKWCCCLVTTKSEKVKTAIWLQKRGWVSDNLLYKLNDVIAWCQLSDIKPYNEK